MAAVQRIYAEYVDNGFKEVPAFKGVGKAYIKFAAERPNLFMLLFMNEKRRVTNIASALCEIDGGSDKILRSVKDEYGLSEAIANKLYLHMWIYTHGIASLIATSVCDFTPEEISNMLTEVCAPLIKKYKEGSRMIKAIDVCKSYNKGTVKVLNGVSLEISRGEFAIILGASGSGKFTL